MAGTIQMGPERHPFFGNFAEFPQAKHLKTAAIGQYSAVPVHEPVKAAGFPDGFVAGTQE